MKIIPVAVNAQYIHTNPAVRGIAALLRAERHEVMVVESTINNTARALLAELYHAYTPGGTVYIFSCYIWNIDMITRVAADLRRVCPDAVLAAAGPQVSYHCARFLAGNPAFDYVLYGEGETSTPLFAAMLAAGNTPDTCPGLYYRLDNGDIACTEPAPLPDMDALPFAYTDLAELPGRILYYESMRGCPFACSYCLSGAEGGVRTRALLLVYGDLQRFLDARVPQVKFVDRTFNARPAHAMGIWRYLMENDNGVTNFHFELSGELLNDDMLSLLHGARPGLFQFEIGVQSGNEQTLAEINRPFSYDRLRRAVDGLLAAGNIHLHLDLIAGLPHEDFESFGRSFDAVFALNPEQLQLGFLKVLPGSEMEEKAESYGLVASPAAPFEVLHTRWLSFGELQALHGIADLVDSYHNSGRFRQIMGFILPHFASPFACYLSFWQWFVRHGYAARPLSKIGYYDILADFMADSGIAVTPRAKWLCKYDVLCNEKPRKYPKWVDVDITAGYYHSILAFLSQSEVYEKYLPLYRDSEPKHVMRLVHVEIFPAGCAPEGDFAAMAAGEMAGVVPTVPPMAMPLAVLFDYRAGRRFFFRVGAEGEILLV